MNLAIIDIVLLVILAYGLIMGLWRGFFVEITSLLALLLGIWGALHFSDQVASWLIRELDFENGSTNIVAFVLTFVGILLAVVWIGKLMTKVADLIALGWLNQIAGGVFGLAKMAVILSILLSVLLPLNAVFDIVAEEELEESELVTPLTELGAVIFPKIQQFKMPDELPELPNSKMKEEEA